MGQERLSDPFLRVHGCDFGPKICAAQITCDNSIFTPCMDPTKKYSKITLCIKKVTPCAIDVTRSAKCTQLVQTVAPATVCAPCPSQLVQAYGKVAFLLN